jgi:DNA-binding beta-propeller fold protein YncE
VYLDELGVPSGTYGPHHIVFEPDGSAWFVSLVNGGAEGAGRIVKLSTSLTTDPGSAAYLLAQSPAFTTPGMMAVNPATNQLFVGRSTLSQAGTPGVGVFDRATLALIETVATPFDIPHALAITTDGAYVLTASLTGNTLATIRTADLELTTAPLSGPARELIHFGVHPAIHTAAAGTDHAAHGGHAGHDGAAASLHLAEVTLTSRNTDEVLFLRLNDDGTLTENGSVAVGDGPYHAHLGADGHTLLVPNQFGGSVSLVDVATRSLIRTVENPAGGPLARPHSPAPGMDASVFFVTNSNWPANAASWAPTYRFLSGNPGDASRPPLPNEAFGNVAAFDAATGAVRAVIQLRAYPAGLEHPMVHHH